MAGVTKTIPVATATLTGSPANTTITGAAGTINYAREVGGANATYNFPGWSSAPCSGLSYITHQMNVIRSFNNGQGSPQNYFVDITLDDSAVFTAAPGASNGSQVFAPDITVQNEPTILVYRVIDGTPGIDAGALPNKKVRYYISITGNEIAAIPTININLAKFAVKDVANQLNNAAPAAPLQPNTIDVTVATFDASDGTPFDAQTGDMTPFMKGVPGVALHFTSGSPPPPAAPGSGYATIDVFENRQEFVENPPYVRAHYDNSATMVINTMVSGVFYRNGCAYGLTEISSIQLTITADVSWAGVTDIYYDGIDFPAPSGGFVNPVILKIAGNDPSVQNDGTNPTHIKILVDGVAQLVPQQFHISVDELVGGLPDGPVHTFNLLDSNAILTTWDLNGTILTAIFQNATSPILNGRLYLWNASNQVGMITASVYTLPTTCAAAGPPCSAVIAPSTLIGSVTFNPATYPGFALPGAGAGGTIGGGLNLRVYEDIFRNLPANPDPKVQWLGWPSTFATNSGNVVVVLTITAKQVRGWSNVWTSTESYGVVNMLVTAPALSSLFDIF
ncbi:MAG: hypothetical protein ABSH28_15880 [Acidobacteriota bacterium]